MANNGAGTQTSLDLESGLYRIGEVSRMTGVKAFVLRYWETEFPMLEPEKSPNGRRCYRQEDVELIRKIKRLLYDEGFTIAGARRPRRQSHQMGMSSSNSNTYGDAKSMAGSSRRSITPPAPASPPFARDGAPLPQRR